MQKKIKIRGRPPILTKALDRLKKLGVFQVADAKRVGISQSSLSRFVREKRIRSLEPRFYIHPESKLSGEELEFALACKKFGPESVIGGLTALFHYGLIEEVPGQIWIIVPYAKKSKDLLYKCIRSKTNPQEGVEDKTFYRITTLERTLVEAFRYSSKIGEYGSRSTKSTFFLNSRFPRPARMRCFTSACRATKFGRTGKASGSETACACRSTKRGASSCISRGPGPRPSSTSLSWTFWRRMPKSGPASCRPRSSPG